ncbi:hypothetical protein Tco_0530872 [Tanacetum coccineum]
MKRYSRDEEQFPVYLVERVWYIRRNLLNKRRKDTSLKLIIAERMRGICRHSISSQIQKCNLTMQIPSLVDAYYAV